MNAAPPDPPASRPLRVVDRVFVALAFGTAGVVSLVALAGAISLTSGDGVREALAYWGSFVGDGTEAFLLAAFAGGALGGAWRAGRFREPAGPGAIHADVTRGMGTALAGFVAGAVLMPLLAGLLAGAEPSSNVVSSLPLIVLAGLLVGTVFVLPVALVFGGATGWWVGRVITRTRGPVS